MAAGRKPTPTALKLVKGNPGKQATLEATGATFEEVEAGSGLVLDAGV